MWCAKACVDFRHHEFSDTQIVVKPTICFRWIEILDDDDDDEVNSSAETIISFRDGEIGCTVEVLQAFNGEL